MSKLTDEESTSLTDLTQNVMDSIDCSGPASAECARRCTPCGTPGTATDADGGDCSTCGDCAVYAACASQFADNRKLSEGDFSIRLDDDQIVALDLEAQKCLISPYEAETEVLADLTIEMLDQGVTPNSLTATRRLGKLDDDKQAVTAPTSTNKEFPTSASLQERIDALALAHPLNRGLSPDMTDPLKLGGRRRRRRRLQTSPVALSSVELMAVVPVSTTIGVAFAGEARTPNPHP